MLLALKPPEGLGHYVKRLNQRNNSILCKGKAETRENGAAESENRDGLKDKVEKIKYVASKGYFGTQQLYTNKIEIWHRSERSSFEGETMSYRRGL